MKTSKLFSGAMLLLMLFSCSDSNDPSPLADLFVPNLSNQWASSRNSFFFFTADAKGRGTNKSTFTGSEQKGGNDDLTGSYENYDVQFTFDVSKVTYKGKFIKGSDPLRMELKGTDGESLTLIQQQVNNE